MNGWNKAVDITEEDFLDQHGWDNPTFNVTAVTCTTAHHVFTTPYGANVTECNCKDGKEGFHYNLKR